MSQWIDKLVEENRKFRHLYEKFLQYGTPKTGKHALASLKKMREYVELAHSDLSKSVKAIKKVHKNDKVDKLLNINDE